jgi:CBS domain-containing protein
MKVSSLLDTKGKEVFSIEADKTIEDAVRSMGARKISAMMVSENGKTVGIFTERDVVRCYIATDGKSFKDIKLREFMVTNLITAGPDDDVNTVAATMVEKNIRHLPVTHNNRVIGMLSIRDLIQTQVGKLTSENLYLRGYITGTESEH